MEHAFQSWTHHGETQHRLTARRDDVLDFELPSGLEDIVRRHNVVVECHLIRDSAGSGYGRKVYNGQLGTVERVPVNFVPVTDEPGYAGAIQGDLAYLSSIPIKASKT